MERGFSVIDVDSENTHCQRFNSRQVKKVRKQSILSTIQDTHHWRSSEYIQLHRPSDESLIPNSVTPHGNDIWTSEEDVTQTALLTAFSRQLCIGVLEILCMVVTEWTTSQ